MPRTRLAEPVFGAFVGGKFDFLETFEECAVREARKKVTVEVVVQALLSVTDHGLPAENRHWVSPAYLARITAGQLASCEPPATPSAPTPHSTPPTAPGWPVML